MTINQTWFTNALDISEEFMRENQIEHWLCDNDQLVQDIKKVYDTLHPVFCSEYELKARKNNLIVNYQVMPLIGSKGVVLVFDDISSEKRAVMTLGRYMSPALAKQLLEENNNELGGTRKKVSILFSDIRSFTTLSEGMEPTEVVDLLNAHFTDAVNAITEEQGILDKFIGESTDAGDAVMAVFGVPFTGAEDAIHACNTALKFQTAVIEANRVRAAQGKPTIKVGIGINTGMVNGLTQVLSGNIGSKKRMEFSCIGDAVNLSSRTEGLTKMYGLTILVTEYTLIETNDQFLTREIDAVIVKGKNASVRIYELMGKRGEILPIEQQQTAQMYSLGLEIYRRRAFEEAMNMFTAAFELTHDGPSRTMLARCKQFIESPPPANWNGVYVAEDK